MAAGIALLALVVAAFPLTSRLWHAADLEHRRRYDALTALPNWSVVHDRLQALLGRVSHDGTIVALLLLDIDRFKVVNDGRGHGVGDSLLRQVARRLHAAAGEHLTLARVGGDEFVLLVEDAADRAAVIDHARRVASCFAEPFRVDGATITVSVSIGVAIASDDRYNANDLLRNAEVAMYRAKATASGWAVCDDALLAEQSLLLETEQALHGALDRAEFVVRYQPIFDIEDWEIVGVEALLRWHHPQRGLLAPGAFLPLAEDIGVIHAIDRHVVRQACADIALLNECGFSLRVSVNVAASHLGVDFADAVSTAIAESGIDARSLCIEITESSVLTPSGGPGEAIAMLRKAGVRIAVDDFGTGWSSLSYLQHVAFDELKIDRSFVEHLGDDRRTSALTKAIVDMAEALDLTVVAEGVETPAQLRALRQLGCRLGQGYLLDRPMSIDGLRRRLDESRPKGVLTG